MRQTPYHLWITPANDAYDLLRRAITRLAGEFGGPLFEPHLTLAGPLHGSEQEHLDNCRRLAAQLSRFHVSLDQLSHGSEYFRCVFLRAVSSRPLLHANILAKRTFRLPDDPYMPHVSLLYGMYSEAERQRAIRLLTADIRLTFEAGGVDLIRSTSDDPRDWHRLHRETFRPADERLDDEQS